MGKVVAFCKAVPLMVITVILLGGVTVGTANANSHLPDCKANSNCLLELGFAWKTVTADEVQAMIDDDADVNAKTNTGWTPLHAAASNGNAEVILVLVKARADVNAKTNTGWTPLHAAATFGHAEVIPIFVKSGANVNEKTNDGFTPLHGAAEEGQAEVIPVLVQAGADVNEKTNDGFTPLHIAAANGKAEVIPVLVQAGADVNATSDLGHTPLHLAALSGHTEVISVLAKAGADVNAKDDNGYTPLHLAVGQGQDKVISVLIKHGAYIQATDKWGRTPLDLAREYKEWNAVKILEGGSGLASPSCFNIIRGKPNQVVWVNGVPMKMRIDTGADSTHLTKQQAKMAGVQITGEGEFVIADGSVVVNKTGSANISLGGGLSGNFPVSSAREKGCWGVMSLTNLPVNNSEFDSPEKIGHDSPIT